MLTRLMYFMYVHQIKGAWFSLLSNILLRYDKHNGWDQDFYKGFIFAFRSIGLEFDILFHLKFSLGCWTVGDISWPCIESTT